MNKAITFVFSLAFALGFSQTGLPQNIVIDGTFGIYAPEDMMLRDFNNDSKKDVLVKASPNRLFWIKNLGNGFQHPELIYETPVNAIKDYNSADFDGDGKIDIIFSASNGLFLLKNISSGFSTSFSQPIQLSNQDITMIKVADIDGDGDMDIYLHQPSSGIWLKNSGNGTFTTGATIFSSLQKPDSVILRDLDNDGKPDLLVRINESTILRWYKNDGVGNFTLKQTIDTFALGAYFDVGDVDTDGDLDIIYLYENGATKQFKWYKNTNGAGTFSTSQLISALPYNPYLVENVKKYGLKLLDLDGDGKDDLVFCVYWDNKLSWKKNLGGGSFGPEQIVTQNAKNIMQFDAADFNNDSKVDLITTSSWDDKIAWYEGLNGTGSFSTEKVLSTDVTMLSNLVAGDIDGDGDVDLVASSSYKSKLSWYKNNNGQGSFDQQKVIRNDFRFSTQLALADMDNDGDLDVFGRSELDTPSSTYKYVWFENDGSGTFTTEHPVSGIESTVSYQTLIADYNGDGLNDIALLGNKIKILLNTGNGNFSAPVEFMTTVNARIYRAVDMDNDGDLDIVISSSSAGMEWYENVNGLGSFTVSHLIASSLINVFDFNVADLDGDGDKDIYYANYFGHEIGWIENLSGTFGPKKIIGQGTLTKPYAILAIDIDNDGRKDIVTNSNTQPKLRWYKNNGNGVIDNVPKLITNNVGRAIALISADMNGDGVSDLISGSDSTDNTYIESMITWFGQQSFLNVQESEKNNLKVYPNPTTGIVYLNTKTLAEKVDVYNTLGQKVKTFQNVSKVDLSDLVSGVYTLTVNSKEGLGSFKIIKK